VPAITLMYMTSTRIEQNDQNVTDAIAAGNRLHIGVTLSYVGGSSDKFWTGVWAGDRIAVNFGPHNSPGQFRLHDGLTEREGAKKMWDLLRSKVGKGYAVVDAAVLIVPGVLHTGHRAYAAENIIGSWLSLRDARRVNPIRPVHHPEMLGISPRTPTEGAQVLLDITASDATPGALSAAAVVGPTERFLPPIIMSRPDLPYEVKFMAALSGNAKVVI
jgi:predicted DNA-binding WGR domain protein